MNKKLARFTLVEADLLLSPRLAAELDGESVEAMGDAVWFAAYWTLGDKHLVGHGSDVERHFNVIEMKSGSRPEPDLRVIAYVTGGDALNLRPHGDDELRKLLQTKIGLVLAPELPIAIKLHAQFLWCNVSPGVIIEPSRATAQSGSN